MKIIKALICGMAFLFASCSEYKVLETTEVFKIEKHLLKFTYI